MAAKNADNPSLSAEKLKGQQIELILRQLESVPTLPEVATRLLKLTSSNQANTQEVINLVSADQSLTAKILSLAGRANTGLRKEARTISRVVVMLGFEAVRSAVLSIKVFEMFGPKGLSVSGLDRREFWKHCLAVACASDLLGQRLRLGIESEELFVCGLLHDIGKLAMEQCLPKSYTRVVQACNSQYGNIAEYERQILGVDHTIAGRRLAELWHLPELVEQTIWLHHQPVEGLPEVLSGRRAIAVVHLADTIVREQRFGYSGNFTFPADSIKLAAQIGVSAEVLKETIDRLPGLIEERSQLFGVGKTTSESLYRSALTAANLELSRLNSRLQRRAAQAGSQSKALGLLRRFGSELTAAESLGSLCRLMARTWAEAGQLAPSQDEPVIAYVFSSADQAIVLASQTGTEEAEVKLLVSRGDFPPSRPLALGAGGADVLKQLVEDEDALAEVVARTCSAHWPLVCGRQWIGGLFWSPGATRADLTEETIQALAMSMAFAAAVTAAGDRAKMLAEQLGQSSQQLYAAQKALAEASTLVAVGEMAAGAAHEINNPLAVIAGRAQLMADSAAEQDRQTWRTVAQQAQKISGIITEMMEFAKPPAPEAEPVSVRALIEGAKNAVRDNGETRDLIVEARLAPGTPKVFVDPKQMTAVLVELLTNARAACVKDPHALIEAAPDEATGKVLLRVVDKGAGMDAKMLESAFTPFFSACRAGRRRGLGLSKARRWVQLAGGKIWIVSRVEEGTSVFIQLPPASGSAEANEAGVAGK